MSDNDSATLTFDGSATIEVPAAPPAVAPPAPPVPPPTASSQSVLQPKRPVPDTASGVSFQQRVVSQLGTWSAYLRKFEIPKSRDYQRILIGAVAAVVILLVLAVSLIFRGHNKSVSAPPVETTAVPAAPTMETQVQPPQSAPPLSTGLPIVKLSSDATTGKVFFDDQPAAEIKDAQWTLDQIASGDHKLKFEGPQGGKASFAFSSNAGTLPVLQGPIAAHGVLAVIVSSMNGQLQLYSSDPESKVTLDGQSKVTVPEGGLNVPAISAGTHELALSHGNEQYKLNFDVGAQPALNAFLESGQNVGALTVVTSQDRVRVFLNGKVQSQPTPDGQLAIPNLDPKEYSVRVSKDGFQDPPEQKIRIRKGEQAKLTFNLQAVPHLASLSIQSGVPGTTVLVDQTPIGTIQSDGTFNGSSVNPGDHVIELRKERFKPKQIKKHFVAGSTVSLAAAEVALEGAPGELKITYTPPDGVVTLGKSGEAPTKISSGMSLSLPAGSYTLTSKTADNLVRTTSIDVIAGQSKNVNLSLAPSGMTKWDAPEGWVQENGAFVHKGGDFVLYDVSPTSGTFVFSAMLLKGHRLQWVLNYTDPSNYVLFQMDDKFFYRTVMRNGQKGDEEKIPHKGEKKSYRTLQIRVEPGEIVHQIKGDGWVALDKFTANGSNLTRGKFGFYIPGGDQVALSNFGHYADLSVR